MNFLHKLYSIVFLIATTYGYSQTVFVTGDLPETKEKTSLFDGVDTFSNFTFAAAFKGNSEYGTKDPYTDNDENWFIPDGASIHGGFGIHGNQLIGISVNAGIDGLISPKLVAVPLYASFLLNPHIGEETTVYLQAGIGTAFALGRGDLSGFYQKYRLGFNNSDQLGFFVEANYYGFGLYGVKQVSSINLGISLFNFN